MNVINDDLLVIVVGMEHYNPLGMIRALGENGIRPIYIGIKYKAPVASSSKYVKDYYLVDSDQEALDLLINQFGSVVRETGKKPFVLFSDDSTVELFEQHYEKLKSGFIMFNAGGDGRIAKYMDKFEILECAKRHGIQVLPTEVVKRGEFPKNVEYPIITKAISPNSGAWKGDVFICNNEAELKEAYKNIKSQTVIIQHFVDKKTEITYEGYTINRGKDMYIGVQCSYLYAVKGYYSTYFINEPMTDSVLYAKINSMFEEIGFEGIFEVEFLVGPNEQKYFLEINFRSSPWSYFSHLAGNSIAYLWCVSMLTGSVPKANCFEPFKGMVEPVDYLKRVEEGRCSLAEWLKDFKEAKCAYYNPNDMEPYRILCENWDILK